MATPPPSSSLTVPPDSPSGAQAAAAAAHLMEQTLGHLYSAALRTAARLRLADQLAAGPRTPAELAHATGSDPDALRRMLRYLAGREIFREDEHGAYHLTPAAEFLRTDVPGSLHATVDMLTDEVFTRSSSGLHETVRNGEPAFPAVFGASFFERLQTDPALRALFDSGMAAFSEPLNDVVAAGYPFPDRGTVVDVGGGRGGLLRSVLIRHPELTGVLVDQAPALRDHVLDTPELAGRWQAEPGDFFASIPSGGDIYLLKHVVHDWGDEDAARILRGCRDAMAPGGKVLVIDAVLPPGNDPHPGKALDVAMMTIVPGKERGPAELDALFAQAGLRRTRILPTAAFPSIVEAVAATS